MKGEMKDSVFLKTLSSNERKLIKAGEYMTKFKEEYEVLRAQNNIQILIDDESLPLVLDVVNQIEKARLFRGKGGEFMRLAICRLIEAISISKLPAKAVHLKRYMVRPKFIISINNFMFLGYFRRLFKEFFRKYSSSCIKILESI